MFYKYWKQVLLMVVVIIGCSIASRLLQGNETLADYAKNNPDIAYGNSSTGSEIENFDNYDNASISSDESSTSLSNDIVDQASDASTANSTNESNKTIVYDGFYYEPISSEVKNRIWNISYPEDCSIPLSSLRYCIVKYIDFNGNEQIGEMICNEIIADDVMNIFHELYLNDYRIESIKLIDEYDGNDTASMEANNTSCFNYRVVEGTSTLSKHAQGLAIDLNPLYNPYITYNNDGTSNCSPSASYPYMDRSLDFPYKIDENDLAYKLFISHGFTWGGNWNSCKDYQHFQKSK